MGIGFVILAHLIIIFILSVIIASIGAAIAYVASKNENKKRNIILTVITPFIGLYTLYFCLIFGSVLVGVYTKTDIGIGDSWSVSVSTNCQLIFIDVPENGFLECDGKDIASGVSEIAQDNNNIYGKTDNASYFLYNKQTKELKDYSKDDFRKQFEGKIKLSDANDFYFKQRDHLTGVLPEVMVITSLLISIIAVYITIRIGIRISK